MTPHSSLPPTPGNTILLYVPIYLTILGTSLMELHNICPFVSIRASLKGKAIIYYRFTLVTSRMLHTHTYTYICKSSIESYVYSPIRSSSN